jgi:hypothetical protein
LYELRQPKRPNHQRARLVSACKHLSILILDELLCYVGTVRSVAGDKSLRKIFRTKSLLRVQAVRLPGEKTGKQARLTLTFWKTEYEIFGGRL